MRPFLLHSTKFDGSLHYRFPTYVLRESAEELATYTPAGTEFECYRGTRLGASHMLGMFWRGRPWNYELMWTPDWQPEQHYVNIASPATWYDGAVRYIDLDLDVRRTAGQREGEIEDADEFEQNTIAWQYPLELRERCWATVEEVRGMMREGVFPFDDRLFSWRPGSSLS